MAGQTGADMSQEVAGHKLSDSVLERLPTLCTMNPGRKISYSEVFAFHNSERISISKPVVDHQSFVRWTSLSASFSEPFGKRKTVG